MYVTVLVGGKILFTTLSQYADILGDKLFIHCYSRANMEVYRLRNYLAGCLH